MPTSETPLPPGRARLVAIVVLVLVIGTAGALLGPRLLNEPKAPGPAPGIGQVCFEMLTSSGSTHSGVLRLTARGPDRPDLDVREGFPENASPKAVVGLVADSANDAGWGREQGVQIAGGCLALGRVTEVGGSPGLTGIGMSLGLAAEGRTALAIRIGVEGLGPSSPLPAVALHLKARGPVPNDGPTPTAHLDLTAISSADEAISVLRERMDAEGWGFEADGVDGLVVRALPDEASLQSVLLSVSYAASEADRASPPDNLRWTLSIVP